MRAECIRGLLDAHTAIWCNLELIEYSFRIEIDGAVDLFPDTNNQLIQGRRLEHKFLGSNFSALRECPFLDLHLALMLSGVFVEHLSANAKPSRALPARCAKSHVAAGVWLFA